MASAGYDVSRGVFRVYYHDGLRRRSQVVARLPKGSPRPRRDPPEVTRALAHYGQIELTTRRDRPDDPGRTVGDFLAAYQAWYATERDAGSAKELERACRRLLAWAGKVRLAEFGRSDAVAHLDRLRNDPKLAASTIHKQIGLISGAWSRGQRREELRNNPWKNLDLPEKSEPDRPSWTPSEFERLQAVCRPWLRLLVTVGVYSGLRIGELIELRWSWVEWESGEKYGAIRVPAAQSKSGRSRRVPMCAPLHDLLFERLATEKGEKGPILRGQSDRPIRNAKHVGICLGLACERAGLPRVGTHACRRTFGRWATLGRGPWQGKPIPIYAVSKALGHSDLKTTQLYLALDDESADDWFAGD